MARRIRHTLVRLGTGAIVDSPRKHVEIFHVASNSNLGANERGGNLELWIIIILYRASIPQCSSCQEPPLCRPRVYCWPCGWASRRCSCISNAAPRRRMKRGGGSALPPSNPLAAARVCGCEWLLLDPSEVIPMLHSIYLKSSGYLSPFFCRLHSSYNPTIQR